jgi:chemotaxis protein MotB
MSRYVKKKVSDQDLDSWLLPFADMITFLMAFFVILYTITAVDSDKAKKMRESVATSFNAPMGTSPRETDQTVPDYKQMAEDLTSSINEQNLSEQLSVERTYTGLKITVSSELLFQSGSAELTMKARLVIVQLVQLVKNKNVKVKIEGHTDDQAINTEQFPSNWELSTARAIRVLKLFSELGVEPSRLMVVGFADTQPLVPVEGSLDEMDQARAKNRRVVIQLY